MYIQYMHLHAMHTHPHTSHPHTCHTQPTRAAGPGHAAHPRLGLGGGGHPQPPPPRFNPREGEGIYRFPGGSLRSRGAPRSLPGPGAAAPGGSRGWVPGIDPGAWSQGRIPVPVPVPGCRSRCRLQISVPVLVSDPGPGARSRFPVADPGARSRWLLPVPVPGCGSRCLLPVPVPVSNPGARSRSRCRLLPFRTADSGAAAFIPAPGST